MTTAHDFSISSPEDLALAAKVLEEYRMVHVLQAAGEARSEASERVLKDD